MGQRLLHAALLHEINVVEESRIVPTEDCGVTHAVAPSSWWAEVHLVCRTGMSRVGHIYVDEIMWFFWNFDTLPSPYLPQSLSICHGDYLAFM